MKTIMMRICCISFCCMLIICFSTVWAEEQEFSLPDLESGRIVLTWSELKSVLDELETLKRELGTLKRDIEDKDSQEEKDALPPLEYTILESYLRGAAEGERVRFETTATIQVFKAGWTTIRLLPEQMGIESVNIALADTTPERSGWISWTTPKSWTEVKEAPLLPTAQIVRGEEGYNVIARGPGTFIVDVAFYAPVHVENLVHTLVVAPPAAVINRLELEIPEKGVHIEQMFPSGRITETEQKTNVQTVLNKNDELRLVWKIDKDTGLHRKRSATVNSLISVEKSAMTVDSTVVLKHLTSLDQVALLLPKDVDILHVTCAMIERWAAEQTEDTQRITLAGQTDRRIPVELTLAYRMPLPELPAQVDIPALQVDGVDMFEGFVGIEVLGNLEVSPGDTQNTFLIPAKNLPDALWQSTSSPLLHGYEFHDNGFTASLDIKRYQEIQTIVANVDLVECVTHRTLAGKSMSRVRYFIRNNDRQFLMLTLPANSRIWQAFLDGEPVKPAQKATGEVLIPMKKSTTQGEDLQSFTIEIGYVTEVNKLSLKGDLLSELPGIDIPMSHLQWTLFLPEDYEYTNFEGPLKHVAEFSPASVDIAASKPHIDIPMQGKQFLFENFLMIDEVPYVRGKYGQYLGDNIYLAVQPQNMQTLQQVTPMSRK